jgi:hypothetical protein
VESPTAGTAPQTLIFKIGERPMMTTHVLLFLILLAIVGYQEIHADDERL